jgi:N-acyl-D-amino-acid deacylase
MVDTSVELVMRDVRIIDGTGAPAVEGDVAVSQGRIAAVGAVRLKVRAGATELDGGGRLVCAPGFVDTHTHDDAALVRHPGLEFKIAQGCTTLVIGNCGFSGFPATGREDIASLADADWQDLDEFRAGSSGHGFACNVVALVGHNTLRMVVGATGPRAPTAQQLMAMRSHVARSMDQGACGVSTGLIYVPGKWSETDELIELARTAGEHGGLYATHMRNEGDRLLESVDEAIAIGKEARCPVHISHHKATGQANWGKVSDSLDTVDRANAEGDDVTLDCYPYTAGSGPMVEYVDLDNVSEPWAAQTHIASCPPLPKYQGRMLLDVAADEGTSLIDLLRRILTAPDGHRTITITFGLSEDDVVTNLRHPLMMIGSDGVPDLRGFPHPRLFGTFPRILGEYVRRRQVIPLEEAVRRMTSLAADRFGLVDRGRVAEGARADLVVFDPDTVIDTATYDDPKREPVGMHWVVVNGEIAYDRGRHTPVTSGRFLHHRTGA